MSWSVQSTFLRNRALTFCRTRRCVYLTGLTKRCDIHRRIHDTHIRGRFVLGRSTASAESPGYLSEAGRLLEEQIRLLEAEREESLSIAQQCTTRSKRLMMRLENLKSYSTTALAQRRGSSAAAAGQRTSNFQRSTPPPNTSRFQSPAGDVSARAAARGTGSGAPACQPMLNRQEAAGSAGIPPESAVDPEEAQTRRLVSQALRRNISRGENNVALAEKLQQYIGLLRKELARVRHGDTSLAAKILERHTARATAAMATTPAPGLSIDVGPPTQQVARRLESLHPADPAATDEGEIALQSRRPAAGRDAAGRNRQERSGGALTKGTSGDDGSGRGSIDASARLPAARPSGSPAAASHSADITANANSRRSRKVGGDSFSDATSHSGSTSGAGTDTGVNCIAGGHGNEPMSIDGMTSSSSSGAGSSSRSRDGARCSGDGGPDAASGLGRIFSRSQVLELPGDEKITAAAAAECKQSTPDINLHPTALEPKSPEGGRTDPEPGPASGPAQPPVAANNSSTSNPPFRGPSLTAPAPNHGMESADGVTAAISETTASGASDLGLSLEAARILSRDSEDARSTLMGLLSPAGLLPGPLQLAGSAGEKKGLVGSEGLPDDYVGIGRIDAGVQDLETEGGRDRTARLTQSGRREDVTEAAVKPQPRRDGLYSLRGEQVLSRTTRVQSPSAAAAAAKAAAITTAAKVAAAAAASECVVHQGPKMEHDRGRSGSPAEPELKALATLLSIMVSELRQRGYKGCDEHVDLAAAQLERLLALARAAAAAAAMSSAGR